MDIIIDLKKLIAKGMIISYGIGSGTYYRLSDYEHENIQITFIDITGTSSEKQWFI